MSENSTSAAPPEVPKDAKEPVAASAEAAKSEAATASHSLLDSFLPQVKDAADSVLTRGLEAAKSVLHNVEEKKGEVSTQLVEAIKGVTHAAGGGGAEAAAATDNQKSRELPVSTDNQPLIASGERVLETTPWWKNCCGVLDLLNPSSR